MRSRVAVCGSLLFVLACGSEPAAEPDPFAEGWRAARAGDHAESAAAYREAAEAAPENLEAWLGVARERLRAGEPVEAATAAERAVALDEASADAHELLGLARLRSDDAPGAVVELSRALELDEERARARFPLARARERAGQIDEAVAAYRAAADAGAQPAHALAAAARVRLDALGDETPEGSVVREVETLLDRAEELAGEDDAVRGAIVAQRRRLERARRVEPRRAVEVARNAGMLRALRSADGEDPGTASRSNRALGALMGDSIGENFGFGGLGLRGTGAGGGGTSEGTTGRGSLGAIGRGAGGGSGYGRGVGGLRGGRAGIPRVQTGAVTVVGGLDRDVARRVLRRHINEVRFCYEQRLNVRPDLAGDVTLALTVSPAGVVSASTIASSSLGDATVDSCIAGASRRWTFPAPQGGGVARVTAPFSLSTSR